MTNVGSVEIAVKLGLDQLVRDADKVRALLANKLKEQKVGVQLDETLGGKLKGQYQAFQEAVEGASLYTQALGQVSAQLGQAGDAINAFSTQAAQAAIAFDSARAKVSTLSDDADGLAARMKELSKELEFQSTSTDLLNASYDVLSSGISETADVAEVLKASTQGALGGFSDVGTVSDAVTTLISSYKSFGVTAQDSTRIVDILAQTQDKGKITIGQYASQIGQVASTASLAGISIEELSAAVATATAKGQDSSSAISGVRQAIVNLLKPTDEAQKYLERFGINNSAAALKTEGLVGVLQKLKEGGATTDELSKIFSDVTGLATVSTLANENLEDFVGNIDAMNNSAGKAAKSAEKVANSIQGQLNAAMNQANEALVDLGKGVTEAVVPLLKILTSLIQKFNELPTPVKESIGRIIAITGGAISLAAALAAVAAVLPVVKAGFLLVTGAATATGAAILAALPPLALLAAGVYVLDKALAANALQEAGMAIEDFAKQAEISANVAFDSANRTAAAVDKLNAKRKEGQLLNATEAKDAKQLLEANKLRLAQLQEDLQLANALPAANEDQVAARENLVKQIEISAKALRGENAELAKAISANEQAAKSGAAAAVTVETIAKKYEESNARITAANKLRQAEIKESIAQGLKTEEQAREDSIYQEEKYQNDRLKLAQENLAELQSLLEVEKGEAKRKQINEAILKAESDLSDARIGVAQAGIEKRKAAEQKAIADIEKAIKASEDRINQSKQSRSIDVKTQQTEGKITDESAALELAQIEQDAIAQTIEAKKRELSENRRLRAEGLRSAEEAATKEAEINQSIGDLTLQQLDAEISAQKAVADARKKQQEDLVNAARDAADARLQEIETGSAQEVATIKQLQADRVLSEQEASDRIADIDRVASAEKVKAKEKELADIAKLQQSGALTGDEAAAREKQLIFEIAQLRQSAAEAEIAQQEEIKQARLDAIDQQLEAEQTASEVRQGLNELERSAIQNQSNLLSAQLGLIQAQSGLKQQRLQGAIAEAEAEGRSTEATRLKKQLLDEQIKVQQQQAAIELQQFELQKEQNALELQNARIQAEKAVTEAQIAIQKALTNNATAEEVANLQKLLDLSRRQLSAIDQQAAGQSKINALEEQALKLKQQQTEESLKQQQVSAAATGSSGVGGGSIDRSVQTFGGGKEQTTLDFVRDQLSKNSRQGTLSDVFNNTQTGLGLTLQSGSRIGGLGNQAALPTTVIDQVIRTGQDQSRLQIAKLDEVIRAVTGVGLRPNLSIESTSDLSTAGKIYSDISRDGLRSAGL